MEVAAYASGPRNLKHNHSYVSNADKFVIPKSNGFFKLSCNYKQDCSRNGVTAKFFHFQRSCLYKTAQASTTVDPYSYYNSKDEALILKKKAQDIGPYLSGRCIYLVGMMGSGKSTVAKILAEVLGYSFFDSDKLVEQAVGVPVPQIFKQYSEGFFRDNESKVLRELSLMHRLVVATGGGAVIRPINWKYMKKGITVWLDVPLEALATRIAAVGTDSRPLVHDESGDAYTTTYKKLTVLSEERGDAYANADAKVCLQRISRKLGLGDVSKLSPTAIAVEVLVQIEGFLEDEEDARYP